MSRSETDFSTLVSTFCHCLTVLIGSLVFMFFEIQRDKVRKIIDTTRFRGCYLRFSEGTSLKFGDLT